MSRGKKAVLGRMRKIKEQMEGGSAGTRWINPHKLLYKVGDEKFQKAIMGVALEKARRSNDENRVAMEFEFWFTLVKDGTKPVRVQMMTRYKARQFNRFNTKNGLKLYWVMGRQKIK